jgi:hypothetical protein
MGKRDGSKLARILAFQTVVSQDKASVGWNLDRPHVGQGRPFCIRFLKSSPIQIDLSLTKGQCVFGQGDDPFDIMPSATSRDFEDHNLSSMRGTEAIGPFVDPEPFPLMKGRQHAGIDDATGGQDVSLKEIKTRDGEDEQPSPQAGLETAFVKDESRMEESAPSFLVALTFYA